MADVRPDYGAQAHALLAGQIAGVLRRVFGDCCKLETDARGDYTGRTILTMPDGRWAVSVEPAPVEPDA